MPIRKHYFRVCIHDFEHPPPHCHVYCKDGTELIIALPLITELFGRKVKKDIKDFIYENLEELIDEWELKNPKKHEA